jgi:hypothetical protein
MVSGISMKANSSIEKFQNGRSVGEQLIDFFEYLFPRLFPSYIVMSAEIPHVEYLLAYPDVKAVVY